ncbi:phospholipase A and acyltransferase 3-like [Triplophysa rosa]|uniref:Retinoic acid receptor responder protein 3 n=1 Tax=Triplophysa rosa TaxID=992332 RepID=A0A9W7T1V0_TRIRA|nr:phospholipase A and acyltransferase 3-like [Triplophysa rosa]XP_057184684.1 phospholipase A and acyltransferase 3-like [Triplophysa rosa]XP_057205785.1 phospholipase A and acyltransferase 3-like [Triplophysa rosa]XP_057205786.1 phospholipase A and acyltransferase 3-like [Triplophysa rosa]XP_057205787.1 phospholipase A and acyltransferase 3-like [Triplophysa rosa]KAI7789233.1 retinoic acid receptor responder protein 3 [Triplophysa rosa]
MPPTKKYDEKPEPGDLIEIFRGGYQHWAIYVGDGFVIHLAPPSEYANAGSYSMMSVTCDRALVKKEEMWDVVGSDEYRINNLLDDKYEPRDIRDILRDAQSLVGRRRPYSVVGCNCEHFVTELRYGKPESRQVRSAVEITVAAGLAMGAIGAIAYAAGCFGSRDHEKHTK